MTRPRTFRHLRIAACMLLAAALAVPAGAQVQAVDPDKAIDSDLMPAPASSPAAVPQTAPVIKPEPVMPSAQPSSAVPAPAPATATASPMAAPAQAGNTQTFRKEDLIGAAEGVFGKGAKGLAGVIKDILKKQGEPNAYIVGREGGGAIIVGLRYGSGTLYHKVEGQKPVYWTGPSIGLDAGANAGNSFVLVYNLYNTDDLYHRFGQGEGQAYLIGGFHVSYLRRGDVVLIPVRTGVGLRLGINAGYMKMSKKAKWLPF